MKLRFEKNHICFRISPKELDLLLKNKLLTHHIMLISYSIELDEVSTAKFDYKDNNLLLVLPLKDVLSHRQVLPNKKGIINKFIFNNTEITVSLEVDVRKYKKV